APPALIALALALPLVNWVLSSLGLWVQMRRHGPVGAVEVALLVGAAWVLNYLPLRPGMIGRIAYHKSVNGIEVVDSVRAVFVGMGCGACAVLTVLGIAAALGAETGIAGWTAALAVP